MINAPQTVPQRSIGMRIGATLLLLPILIIVLVNLVLPTIFTIRASFYNVRIMSSSSEFIGFANYSRLLEDELFWQACTSFFLNALIQIVIVSLVTLIFSVAVQQQSKSMRSVLHALFSLPIAFYAPLSATLLLYVAYRQFEQGTTLLILNSLLSFGIAASLGFFWYSAIWRANQASIPHNQLRRTALLSWLISIIVVLGINLQSFLGEYIFSQSTSFGSLYFRYFFMFFQIGVAQTLASLLIVALAILGLVATIIIITSDLRILRFKSEPEATTQTASSGAKVIGLIVAGLIGLLSFWPIWLLFADLPASQANALETAQSVNVIGTFFGASISAAIQLVLAYLAALAIAALRPLGRHSEWLLLIFAPWLLVGLLPLLGQYFLTARDLGLLNSSLAFLPPTLLNIPLIFLFTLFFKGQAFKQNVEQSFFQRFILPSWPLVLTSAIVLFLSGWRNVLWNFSVANEPGRWNIQTLQLGASMQAGDPVRMFQLASDHFMKLELPISIISALCLIPLAIMLQGLAVRSGR